MSSFLRAHRVRPAYTCILKPSFSRSLTTTQRSMEDTFRAACKNKIIPGAVLLATDKSGTFNYSNVFGARSLEHPRSEPLSVDATMWIASCTKLFTSIAILQCVERGLFTLDEDVRHVLTELNDIDVLTGINGSAIESKKNSLPITLRQLLSHTSGFAYEFNSPLLQQWRKLQPQYNRRPPISVHNRFLHPLLYDPGSSWSYGPSIDWAGVLIERLTGLSLQDYMAQNIWQPLGITDMTFFLSGRDDLRARVASMSKREPYETSDNPTAKSTSVHAPEYQYCFNPDMADCQGGGGVFGSPVEYIKVLRALLLASDAPDVRPVPPKQLLHRSSVDAMFTPQLGGESQKALQAVAEIPRYNYMMGGMPPDTRKDWGLGGLLVMDDIAGWRSKGTMTWGGTPNLTWWIDRKVGLCGLYASQLMPIGDAKSVELEKVFEKAMYERYRQHVADQNDCTD
ncbi:hypothetical protein UA08_04991 [Talaromyces atroroseus]|uniref:Beta-lactamase-related domain-containing protein n=1 Tax=Talaromyces atroroseus TaxID=1441469 RepID=A0A225AQL1_TALAT|nr:hypothetical protein UA08_04991 [Talaromyces atroroseus]OKL59538.1 hypothetical protein UA08_04991 [Talaromyces atroroseus]